MRTMIDTTHAGLPGALDAIRSLSSGDLVALYDTGSGNIAATPADLAEIPAHLTVVMIDQGFTGSPNLTANVRDCENGAWSLSNAINKNGWLVSRPTLYLGFPDTAIQAHNLGWRGDVWLVNPSATPPAEPSVNLPGITVVAEQWNFSNINYDGSVVFDPYWPDSAPAEVPNMQVQVLALVTGGPAIVLPVANTDKLLTLLADPGAGGFVPPSIRVGFFPPWSEHTANPTWDKPASLTIPAGTNRVTLMRTNTGNVPVTAVLE